MKIVFLPEVQLYLQELAHILYFNNYFGSEESAEIYVRELWHDIMTNLPSLPKREAPLHFSRYGRDMYLVSLRKNKHTYWYVLFHIYSDENGETVYLIRHITNNHVSAHFL